MLPTIESLEVGSLHGLKSSNAEICTLGVSVSTGLEEVAAEEIQEKLKVQPKLTRGNLFFDAPIDVVPEVIKLRSIDHVVVVLSMEKDFHFSNNRDECFNKLYRLANAPDWVKGVKVWKMISGEKWDVFKCEQILSENTTCPAQPEVDLKKIKKASSIYANLSGTKILEDILIKRGEKKIISKYGDVRQTKMANDVCGKIENDTNNVGIDKTDNTCVDNAKTTERCPTSYCIETENNVPVAPEIEVKIPDPENISEVDNSLKTNTVEDQPENNSDYLKPETEIKPGTETFSPSKRKIIHEQLSDSNGREKTTDLPTFRISCHRVGNMHCFGSPEAARQFGAGISDKFKWPVNLSKCSIDIQLNIDAQFVYVAIALTREPLFKRNLTHFGPTNLRASLCYNLMRLAKPKPGELILDPMCGGATIAMEGALTYPSCFYLNGDIGAQAVTRSRCNISHLSELAGKGRGLPVGVANWDVTALPLRDHVIDAVVCDLPFGRRVGTRADNRVLYLKALIEMARVTRPQFGRAVLLTYDKQNMIKNLQHVYSLWRNVSSKTINIGGLAGCIFLLVRTSLLSDPCILSSLQSCKKQPYYKKKTNSAH